MTKSAIKPRNIFFFISALYLLSCVIAMVVLSVIDKDVIKIKSVFLPKAEILEECGLKGKLIEIDEEINSFLLEENLGGITKNVRGALKLENSSLTALEFSRRSEAKKFIKEIKSRGFHAEINKNIVSYSLSEGYESLLSGSIVKENNENYIFHSPNGAKILLKGNSVGGDITAIGMRAFASSEIKDLTLNKNITRIYPQAFISSKLESVSGETSGLIIDNSAFFGCINLKSFILNGVVNSIGENAFSECTVLSELTLPGIKTISKNAFYGCRSLAKVDFGNESNYLVTEENEIFTLDKSAIIKYFGNKKTLTLAVETKVIAAGAFSRLVNLESVAAEGKILKIEDSAFESCIRYNNSSIIKDAEFIGKNAFINTKISALNFSEKLTEIGDNAFRLTNIKEVSIPASVKSIGSYAFKSASDLRRVNVLNSSPFNIGTEVFDGIYRIFVSVDSVFKENWKEYSEFIYPFSSISSDFAVVEKNGGLEIVQYLGSDENIVIPKTILGKDVTSIGVRAFSKLHFIKDVQFEANSKVATVSDFAFEAANSLIKISLPVGLKTIGRDAFRTCASLENVTIPSSVNSVGGYSFDGTPWQKNSSGFVIIGDGILYRYNQKNAVAFVPSGVKQVGERAFMNCNFVTDIILPGSLEIVQSYAFLGCSALKKVDLKEGVHTLADSVFSGCSSMKEITLPKSIEYLGYMSFYKQNFSRITVLNPKPFKLGYQVFHYMTDWNYRIIVPKGTLCLNATGKCGFTDKATCYRHASGWAAYKQNIVEVA